jgi:chromosome segregation ATPase
MSSKKLTDLQKNLAAAIAQKEVAEDSLNKVQQRIAEITELLKNPSSNVPELTSERCLSLDSLEAFNIQVEILSSRVLTLEIAIATETEALRIQALQRELTQKKQAFESTLPKIEAAVAALSEALAEAYQLAQPINALAVELGQPHPIAFGHIAQVHINRKPLFGGEIAIGNFGWLDLARGATVALGREPIPFPPREAAKVS